MKNIILCTLICILELSELLKVEGLYLKHIDKIVNNDLIETQQQVKLKQLTQVQSWDDFINQIKQNE